MSSVERQVDVDLDADENAARAVVEERREVALTAAVYDLERNLKQ